MTRATNLCFGLVALGCLLIGETGKPESLPLPDGVARDTIVSSFDSSGHDLTRPLTLNDLRKVRNIAFRDGEYLRFELNYSFVTAAEALLRTRDTLFRGRRCYLIDFALNSKPFFDAFYRVRDRYYTFIDVDGLFPWRFEQHIREGGYSKDFSVDFDQLTHTAVTPDGKYSIPSYVQDIMSAFYYSRTVDYSGFTVGQRIHFQNFYKDSTYQLDVKYWGKQTVEVDAGKFNCIVIEPLVKEGGLFKGEGKIFIWLTDDDRKMPVMVTTKIKIGSVDAQLVEFVGIAGPVTAKIPKD
ncbi:MAG TPA: DUF3108 domain-containing protein [Bacteroidota bacterium]|nr:DUF3108 domain-containing protein [Bacteroidota bacterium]